MGPFFVRLFLGCFIFLFNTVCAELLSPEMGTIIVTYQTDQEGQRLDRIRFWLINEKQERTLYPKKDEFVVNNHSRTDRTIVITHLPVGKYRIVFLVPNTDHYFEELVPKEVELTPGLVAKVDQFIRRKVISNNATAEVGSNEPITTSTNSLLPVIIVNHPSPTSAPYHSGPLPIRPAKLTLNTNFNIPWRLMHDGQLIYSGSGSINNLPIPPGRHYYLMAKDLPGYSLHMIPPNPFDVVPGESIKIELLYQHDVGYIELKGQSETELSVKIYHEQHQQPPVEITIKPNNGQILWQSGALATGQYLVIFELSDHSILPEKQHFLVRKGRRTDIVYPLTPRE